MRIIYLTKVSPLPYARPKGRVKPLPKAASVTIVAGFKFDDGILICGDTKHTGVAVQHKSKIHTKEYPSGAKSVFALAGRSPLARMAIAECETAIEASTSPTLQEMQDAVVDVLINIHTKHVFPHPLRGYSGGPDFNLVVGLFSPHDGVGLYSTEETALDVIPTFHCIGTGEYLGRYIIHPRYPGPQASLSKVLFTAITALSRIKNFDADCGGKSLFAVLRSNGELGYESEFDISQGEKFSDTFFNYATSLYTLIAESPLTDEEVKRQIDFFVQDINGARGNLQTEKDYRDMLMKSLLGDQNLDNQKET
jgi:20S proteasome alpha/beta subunit